MTGNDIEGSYYLSPAQQAILYLRLSAPRAAMDVFQIGCRIQEPVDAALLRKAWQTVLQRHPMLRVSFRWEGVDEAMQDVNTEASVPFIEMDWRHLNASERSEKLAAFLESDRREGFDAGQAPLFRLALLRLESEEYELIWTSTHLILDGRSLMLVQNESFECYEAYRRGEVPQFLPLPRCYWDYVEWCRREDLSKAEAFWRDLLKGFKASTPLPVDKVSGSLETLEAKFGQSEMRLSEATTKTLGSVAKAFEVTLNTVIQGAWAVLLSRYSGEEDVVFGATRACRQSSIEGAADIIGTFNSNLPVRACVSHDRMLSSVLKDLRKQHFEVSNYEHVPLAKIQRWSDIPAGTPLFESAIVFHNYTFQGVFRREPGALPRHEFSLYPNLIFPLYLRVYREPELLIQLVYDRNRFDEGSITRLLNHLRTLLDGIAANPEQRVGELPFLTENERLQLLVEWNETATEFPQDKCVQQLFEEQVARTPDRTALIFDNQRLTYRELNQRSNLLAHYLRKQGVGPDVLVGLYMERSVEMVVGVLGILKAGGAYVPLDPRYPPTRVAIILEDAQMRLLITQAHLVGQLPSQAAGVIRIDAQWSAIAAESEKDPIVRTKAQDLAYVLYTSGSTGRPKGVAIEHRNTAGFIAWAVKAFSPEDLAGVLFSTSLCFDLSVFELFVTLCAGGTVIGAENALELKTVPAAGEVTLVNTGYRLLWRNWCGRGTGRPVCGL